MYMPALNKDNIRGLVTFDRPEVLWDALHEGHGVVMLACHMDNWEWLGAGLALHGFPLSAVEKPNQTVYTAIFMNESQGCRGKKFFLVVLVKLLGCARAMKKGRMLRGLQIEMMVAVTVFFVPFLGKMASTLMVLHILPVNSKHRLFRFLSCVSLTAMVILLLFVTRFVMNLPVTKRLMIIT